MKLCFEYRLAAKLLASSNWNEHFIFTFRRKNFFEKKKSNSVVGVFSFARNCPWRADFVSAESLVSSIKYVSGVTAAENPEVVVSNPAVDHNIYILLDTR